MSGAVLLLVAFAGYFLARALSARTMFLIVYGLVGLIAGAWVLGRRRLSVEARRSDLPLRVREGQLVDVELELKATRRIATIVLEEQLDPALGNAVKIPVPVLPQGEAMNHVYSFVPRRRGVYRVGPLVATWSDPFGLTTKRLTLIPEAEILVHPTTQLVHDRVLTREWEDPPIRPPMSKPWPTGFEFYGMRDYVSGDDPRRIVWRATARTLDPDSGAGRYLVRESEQGITDRVTLVLDTHRPHHSPGEVSETFETSIRTIASLGDRHLKDGFSVTMEMNGRRVAEGLRGQRSRIPMLDALARATLEDVSLAQMLDRLMTGPRRNTHSVLVTPHLDEEATRRLTILIERGASVLIAMVLGEEYDRRSLHRAGLLNCSLVEIRPGDPLEAVFQNLMGAGVRR